MSFEYFKGDGSFIRNNYAIFREGLGGQDPNPIALDRGYEAGYSLLSQVSYHGNSSFSKLINYLERIQVREARKEREFISKKLIKLKEVLPEEYYTKINIALEKEDYSSAYTLLQNFHKDLSELKREISSDKFTSFQKTNSFWATSFAKYLGEELENYLTFEGDKLIASGTGVKLEDLVDKFLIDKLGASNGIIAQGLELERERYLDQLEKVFKDKGIVPKNWNRSQPVFNRNRKKNYDNLAKGIKKNKNGESKSIKTIGETLGNSIMWGIGSEIQAAVNAKRTGSTAIMTGRFERTTLSMLKDSFNQNVQQKGDVLTIDVFTGEYDLDKIVKKIFNNQPDITIEQLRKEITETLPELEIFETSENIKGYRSGFDLKIEQEGNFNRRLANLKKLTDSNEVFDKLIFILINTTEGCLFDKRLDEIGNYIAAAFAAWMWDDYDEIYNLKNKTSNYKKLHIFNSGGAYFTASTLMKATLEQLKNNYDENGMTKRNVSSLVNVDIKPGHYSDREYLQLVQRYPVSSESAQADLKLRWEAVKAAALERGHMSISIRQKELDKLLGNLEALIKEN